MIATIGQLVQTYGYWAVFLAVGAESLGVPIPGETTLIAAAVFAGATHRLSLVYLVIVASVAAIAGDNLGYLIGRGGGYRLLRRYGHRVHVDETKLKVGRYLFAATAAAWCSPAGSSACCGPTRRTWRAPT